MSDSANETLNAENPQRETEKTLKKIGGFSGATFIIGVIGKAGRAAKSTLLFLLPKKGARFPALSTHTMSMLALIIAVGGFAAAQLDLLRHADNARIESLERSLRVIESRLSIPGAAQLHSADYANQLLAIQFVTNAAERSTPFDTALAVAIRMTGEHKKIGPLLDALLTEAPNGVPSRDDLRTDFKERLAKLEKDGVIGSIAGPTGNLTFGFGGFLGLGASEASKEDTVRLRKLSDYIAADRFPEAVQLVGKLDGKLRDGLESWREKAVRRVALDETLAELRRIAFLGIIGNG